MTVKQAAQVLDLLEYFAKRRQPATLSEISEDLGWPRSSTFNLLTTLAGRGFIYEPRPRAGYYPTPMLEDLTLKITSGQVVPPETNALLAELSEMSGETAVLAAQSGQDVVFLASAESAHAMRYTAPKGKLVPLVSAATGRALLAQRPLKERSALLKKARYKAYTPTSLMSAEAVEAEIQKSLERGWFEGHQEYSLGMVAVAFPVFVHGRSYAVLIAGAQQRIEHCLVEIAEQAKAIIVKHVGPDGLVKTLA
ncbi:IclR family transcriptional regulator [Ottowia thiooxydans]|uniref:IclR family acetate operon transcriptional repressor n=1 Tax=Ottowia thiooxydans TaxID=219182 RepID=A0ABV2Q5P5_9BURK